PLWAAALPGAGSGRARSLGRLGHPDRQSGPDRPGAGRSADSLATDHGERRGYAGIRRLAETTSPLDLPGISHRELVLSNGPTWFHNWSLSVICLTSSSCAAGEISQPNGKRGLFGTWSNFMSK